MAACRTAHRDVEIDFQRPSVAHCRECWVELVQKRCTSGSEPMWMLREGSGECVGGNGR